MDRLLRSLGVLEGRGQACVAYAQHEVRHERPYFGAGDRGWRQYHLRLDVALDRVEDVKFDDTDPVADLWVAARKIIPHSLGMSDDELVDNLVLWLAERAHRPNRRDK
jgi:hypothetical protein